MPLPLKVRLSIRQTWDAPDCASQKALQTLSDMLGRRVTCDPDWHILHAALSPFYASDPSDPSDPSDAAQLVSDTAAYIQCWARAARDVLEHGDAGEALAHKLLEAMSQSGVDSLRLAVEIASSNRPQTKWHKEHASFVLLLPPCPPRHDPTAAVAVFRSQIMSAFDTKTAVDAPPAPPVHEAHEWVAVARSGPASEDIEPAYVPDVNTLPRPDELLSKPPYHLHIAQGSAITIQCSHSPSLSFLDAYFKKWCRTNSQLTNRPAMVYVSLNQSPFGLGPLYDTLILEVPRDHRRAGGLPSQLSIPIVLHLVERVLGYNLVFSNPSSWQYRRDTPLRNM